MRIKKNNYTVTFNVTPLYSIVQFNGISRQAINGTIDFFIDSIGNYDYEATRYDYESQNGTINVNDNIEQNIILNRLYDIEPISVIVLE